jgi:glycosyltransferase involved in cell wall biosynthesis
LHKWLRRNGSAFDVVHVHGLLNPISSLSSRECVRNGWPVVVRPFGTLSAYTIAHRRSALKQLYFAMLERRTLRRVSAVHFTTAVERDESLGHGIAWGARAFVIPPSVGNRPAVSERSARTSSNVLVIARLNPVKHLELLLDAWPLVLQSISNAQLVIAGDGDSAYVRALHQKARSCQSVHFAGAVEGARKQQLLEESDLFVLPSFHENFGIAVL